MSMPSRPPRRMLLVGVAIALVIGASALAATAKSPAPARTGLEPLEKQVQEFTLANGLRFLVVERHQAPVFSFFTVVNSGSATTPSAPPGSRT